MFIKNFRSWMSPDGTQHAQGLFLLFMHPDLDGMEGLKQPMKALVRHTRMYQCGHFMMGSVRVGGQTLVVSGSYGSDGLPKDVPQGVYDLGLEVPGELVESWNKGGGWNGAGNEANLVRAWAVENLDRLRKPPLRKQGSPDTE